MKQFYLTLGLLAVAVISFSQTFQVHTAKSSGPWTDPANWTTAVRTDGVSKNKVIIPKNITIVANNGVNSLGLGDVEIVLYGSITISAGTNLNLSDNSSIQVEGGSIIGDNANQKIKIGSDIKYKGNNDGIITGYFITDNTTGSSPSGFRVLAILPVNFTSFYVSKSAEKIQLTWSTDKEINHSHFDVERSLNGTDWQTIAVVKASQNGINTNNYSYHDKTLSSSVVYYRLRQVDSDGRFFFSSIKTIRLGDVVSPVRIFGSDKKVVVDLNREFKSAIMISVVGTSGQVIFKRTFINPSYRINLEITNSTTGAYIVQVSDNKGWSEVRKVIL